MYSVGHLLAAGFPVAPALPLVMRAAESRDGHVRLAAVAALARSDDPTATAALVDRVGDGITVVASRALAALEERASVPAARAIRGRFPARVNPAPEIRRAAVRFAGLTLPLEEAKSFLASLLEADDAETFLGAARALAERGDPAGTRALRSRLESTSDPDGRLAVLSALAAVRAPDAVAPLRRLAAGPDREIAVGATVALGRWGEGPALEVLRELARHGSGEVAREARHELLRLGDPGGTDLVREMLSGDAGARRTAAALVGSARAGALADDLAAALAREGEPSVRRSLAASLSAVGDASAGPVLARVLVSEPNEDAAVAVTAHNAAEALLRLPALTDDTLEILRAAARDGGAGVRLNATRVLGGFGRAPEVLEARLRDPAPAVRIAAAAGYARTPGATVAPLEDAFRRETDPDAARALLSAAKMVYYRWQR